MSGTTKKIGPLKKKWAQMGPKPFFQGRVELIAPLNIGLTKKLLNTKRRKRVGLHNKYSISAHPPTSGFFSKNMNKVMPYTVGKLR